VAQYARLAHALDPVPLDVGLEAAELLGQLRADVGLDRVPRSGLDEPVHERVGEGLRVLDRRFRIRAAAAARDEQAEDERDRCEADQAAVVCSCFR
jgi:hypothetical protein